MKKATLLTSNDLELDCLILARKPVIPFGEEVLVYCQNRLVKGYFVEDLVAELSVIVNFVIAPELEEILYELQNNPEF